MPLKHNRFWMFWGILLAILGLILFNFTFFPVDFYRGADVTHAAVVETKSAKQAESRVEAIRKTIDFAKKAACHHNIQVINTFVELWYIQHDGEWPKSDFSDIGHDIDYFPRGVPRCPVNGEAYRLDPVTHWVFGHDHGDIKTPSIHEPEYQHDIN